MIKPPAKKEWTETVKKTQKRKELTFSFNFRMKQFNEYMKKWNKNSIDIRFVPIR